MAWETPNFGQDPQRLFKNNQKSVIRDKSFGLCAKCYQKKSQMQFHHILPHHFGGATLSFNGAMVCRECHSILTKIQNDFIKELKQMGKWD